MSTNNTAQVRTGIFAGAPRYPSLSGGPRGPADWGNVTQPQTGAVTDVERNRNKRLNVQLTLGECSEAENQRRNHRNKDAIQVFGNNVVPIDFLNGFATIDDFWSIFFAGNTHLNAVVQRVHQLTDNTQPLVRVCPTLYKDHEHGESLDMTPVLELLVQEGFVQSEHGEQEIKFIKFTDRNLPLAVVEIRKSGSRGSTMFDGFVGQVFFEKLQETLLPQLLPRVKGISIAHLKDYHINQGELQGGAFEPQALNAGMDYAQGAFYPWITEDLTAYFEEFMASRSNVLVLIGPPGTGKSTLIRTAIRNLNISAMLAYKQEVIGSPHFISTCQSFLAGASQQTEGEDAPRPVAVVVEDADVLMGKRAHGNVRMAEILNATSGVASDNRSKFILSTNLNDIDEIDPALLRPGRCFDILCFRPLTAAEANAARVAAGMTPADFQPERKYKLAEALNDARTQNLSEPVIKPRFGFSPQ